MRAARWFRESTAGQWDNFGPDAQREQQDRAIDRYGLVDAGPRVVGRLVGLDVGLADRDLGGDGRARPGRAPSTSSSSATSAASCATSSRPSSRSRTISTPRASSSCSRTSGCCHRTRRTGTSSSGRRTRPRRTAASSPSASARATPRSGDGSACPAATGRPTASSARASPRSCGSTRRRPPSSSGPTSSPRPARPTGRSPPQTGLAKTHVGELLTNPIYAGRLRTGEAGGDRADRRPGALVDGPDDARAAADPDAGPHREARLRPAARAAPAAASTSTATSAATAIRRPTCEAFLAATPIVRRRRYRDRDHDKRIKGHSYPQEWYEDAIGALLGQVGSLDDHDHHRGRAPATATARRGPIELALARIDREREEASQRLAKTRDIAAWQATMARLDAEAAGGARQPGEQDRLSPAEVVAYLRSLPVALGRRRTRRTPGAGHGAVRQDRSGGLREDGVRAHTRCHRTRARRGAAGACSRSVADR